MCGEIISFIIIQFCNIMATRSKYTLVKGQPENNEAKPDTDIIMRFQDRYGTTPITQEGMSQELSLFSSDRARTS